MLYNTIYEKFRQSPDFFRKFLYLVPLKYRLGGKNFIGTYHLLAESEHWSKERLVRYQKTQLQELLEHAQKNVPFYSNIKLASSDPFKNLESLPLMDKNQIQQQFNQFVVHNLNDYHYYHVTTGGTTGNSLNIFLDNSTYGREWAFVLTGWRRVRFKPGDRTISFRGVEFRDTEKGIYWQDNPIYNMMEMSPFHMSENNLPQYIKKIQQFKPKYLHGYPSAISILANYVLRNEIPFPKISGVLAISENIYPEQRELIEKAFGTRLFSFYGMSEKVINAPECELDTRYHCFPQYGITEVVDKNGFPVDEGEQGELVGTGFLNYCMPFIRYRTGDFATLHTSACGCKRPNLLLSDLKGRWMQEMLIGKDGTLISMTAMNLHSDVFKNVHRYQFQQSLEGFVDILIVPSIAYNSADEQKVRTALFSKVGTNIVFNLKYVDGIPLTERGKGKLLVQKLKLDLFR